MGAPVTLWVDKDYDSTISFPTQIYAIEVDGEEYLSYEETCDYLSARYMSWMPRDLIITFVLFVLTAMISFLLFLQANKG